MNTERALRIHQSLVDLRGMFETSEAPAAKELISKIDLEIPKALNMIVDSAINPDPLPVVNPAISNIKTTRRTKASKYTSDELLNIILRLPKYKQQQLVARIIANWGKNIPMEFEDNEPE